VFEDRQRGGGGEGGRGGEGEREGEGESVRKEGAVKALVRL
jgi:hypothetical protein